MKKISDKHQYDRRCETIKCELLCARALLYDIYVNDVKGL